MSKTDAAYMKAYRARKKAGQNVLAESPHPTYKALQEIEGQQDRIAELEAEVRHLKAQLAMREPYKPIEGTMRSGPTPIGGAFNVQPIIEPVPYERGKLYPQPGFNSRPFTQDQEGLED